ncbi:MAG: hypothetical protein GF409_07415 [Candidatus Omnitrophica bacterium]|nr:hypothetical protein [Candidatus Omnitrophota bacterium]
MFEKKSAPPALPGKSEPKAEAKPKRSKAKAKAKPEPQQAIPEDIAQTMQELREEVRRLTEEAAKAKAPKAKREKKEELPKRDPTPCAFKSGNSFAVFVPDNWNGVNETVEPEGEVPVSFNGETRRYEPTKSWRRTKKNNGWITYYPRRVDNKAA